jgi:NAD dependent epimerase/dehydratase
MTWAGKKVLVTGAAGFIGGHLTEKLVRSGAEVTAFIRYNSRGTQGTLDALPAEISENIRVIAGDLKDPAAVNNAANNQQIVFNLAALIGIPYSYVHPLDYVQTNINGTAYLLEACRNHDVEKLVHFSTSEVYGTARYVPIDENHPLQGQSPYSASKIAAEQLGLSYYRSFNTPVAIVRPFNTYGPRQPSRAVIPTVISQAFKGNSVRLGSMTPTRDLMYVEDTVEGVMRIANCKSSSGEVINLGTNSEISIGDLAKLIFKIMGKEPEIITENIRLRPEKSEVERLLAATEKAEKMLGWKAENTLEQGLRKTIDWISNNLDFYSVDKYHV